MSGERETKVCQDCGGKYLGGPLARFCPDCRKKHSSQSCHRRRLWDIGAKARWGRPPERVGPSAEMLREATKQEGDHGKRTT